MPRGGGCVPQTVCGVGELVVVSVTYPLGKTFRGRAQRNVWGVAAEMVCRRVDGQLLRLPGLRGVRDWWVRCGWNCGGLGITGWLGSPLIEGCPSGWGEDGRTIWSWGGFRRGGVGAAICLS